VVAIRDGLSRAHLVPIHTAWAEVQAGWVRSAGAYARAEAGWRPLPPLSVYGFGQASQSETMAGVGARVTW
jgi:hypothetical protein